MKIVYANEALPASLSKSIFLAGPTPRDNLTSYVREDFSQFDGRFNSNATIPEHSIGSWRGQAIEYLVMMGYDAVVFVPEARSGKYEHSYDEQVVWEAKMRDLADVILFWVPRRMDGMPGLTTNFELGEDYKTGRTVYGRPHYADKVRYLDQRWTEETGEMPESSLADTVASAAAWAEEGAALRQGVECLVPQIAWNTSEFQTWYHNLAKNGNRLCDFKIKHIGKQIPSRRVFTISAWVDVFVTSENRHKNNEYIFWRPNSASILPYYDDGKKITFFLSKEYRSSALNEVGYVVGLIGGSSDDKGLGVVDVALGELAEESGLFISAERLDPIGVRQTCASLSIHLNHVYAVELDKNEFLALRQNALDGVIYGVDDEERVSLLVTDDSDYINIPDIDWENIGMISQIKERVLAKRQ